MGYSEMFRDLMESGDYTKEELIAELEKIKQYPKVMDDAEYAEILAAINAYYGGE